MKQPATRKSFLGIITILTVIAALLVPAPVFAAGGPGHEPPPPKPPSNDLGKKTNTGKSSPVSVSDLPEDTSVVVTNNGTALPLASKLSVQALSPKTTVLGQSVKFCKMSNPGFFGSCTSYDTIQDAIDAVASIDGKTSGVFYVAVNYPAPSLLPAPEIVLDQGVFIDPTGASNLDMLGGYYFSGRHIGTQGVNPTQLEQPLTIMNINDASSFTLDNFDINVSDFAATTLDLNVPAALQIIDSHNVTLSDLSVTNSAPGGIGALLVNDYGTLSIKNSHFDDSAVAGLLVENFNGDVKLDQVTANNNGNALPTLTQNDISMFVVAPVGAGFVANNGNLTIRNSQFDYNQMAGLWVADQNGPGFPNAAFEKPDLMPGNVLLDNVDASLNGDFSLISPPGWGAYITTASGNVTVKDSQFFENAGTGLEISTGVVQGFGANALDPLINDGLDGNIILDDVKANANYGPGSILDTCGGVPAFSADGPDAPVCSGEGSISVTGHYLNGWKNIDRDGSSGQYSSQFDANGGPGLMAFAANDVSVKYTEANMNFSSAVNAFGQVEASVIDPLFPTAEKAGLMVFALDNQFAPQPVDLAGQYAVNIDMVNLFANDGDGVYAGTPGNIHLDDVNADLNDGVGAYLDNCLVSMETSLHCTAYGMTEVIESGFDANTAIGLLALSSNGIYAGNIEASGNAWAGAVLASPNSIAVTGSQFNGLSDFYAANAADFTPQSFWQPLGLGVVAGEDAYLGRAKDMPFGAYLPHEVNNGHGVQANDNYYAGAVILSGLDVLMGSGSTGVASIDTLNALLSGVQPGDYVGSAYVSHSHFDGNGLVGLGVGSFDEIYLSNDTANGNGVLGSLLLAGSNIFVDRSTFSDNGYTSGILPDEPLTDLLRNGVIAVSGLTGSGETILTNSRANDNFLFGAVALSPDFVGVANGQFDDNGVGGLLAASLGDVAVVNSTANDNGYVGAALAAINLSDVIPMVNHKNPTCTGSFDNDFIYGGFACANGLEANGNGFLGAAVVGSGIAMVDNSFFSGNDWIGPFSVTTDGSTTDIYGGGLVAVGGSLVSMDDVHANNNLGFGAGAFNGGGFLSMFDNMFSTGTTILNSLAPSAYSLDLSNLYTLPIFNNLGTIDVSNSTFSGNTAWGLEALVESHQGVMPPGLSFVGGYVDHVGNFINLSNVMANNNGSEGIYANIASYEVPIPLDFGTAGIALDSSFIATRDLGNFINMDTVQASHNGDIGILASIESNNLNQTEQGQSVTPAAAGATLNSRYSYSQDLTFNWGNFITLNHVITNDNLGGVAAVIDATGATENIFGAAVAQDNSGTVDMLVANPNNLNAKADLTKLLTVNSGNQINLSDVTANRNMLWGVYGSIYSDEQRMNLLGQSSLFTIADSIGIGDGSASLWSNVNQSLHITLTAGDLINMDGVTANDNGMTGINANIVSRGKASNSIIVAPAITTVTNTINMEDGPAKITSRGTVDVQVDLFSGQQINLSHINANRNETGIVSEIDELGNDMGLTYIDNTINVIENSFSNNDISGLDGKATIRSDWNNSLKTSIQTGATINMDGVQADNNQGLGIFTEIYTDAEITNLLNAQLVSSSGNVITRVTGSGKETATLNNLLDAGIIAGNQITFHNVDASHNSSGPCAFDQLCNDGLGVYAFIFSGGSIQNYLNPGLESAFTNVDVGTQDVGITASEDITNNLLAAIHSGNLIDLKTVNANANDQFGIRAVIDDHIKYENMVTPILDSSTSQVAMAVENPALTVKARVDNDIQSLLDSGNAIHMQNVNASQNGFGGIWAEVTSHDMVDNNLKGQLAGSNVNVTQVNSGNASVQTDFTNTFGISLFNEDGIQMDHINASLNGSNPINKAGDGIFAGIDGLSLRTNSIASSLLTNSTNQAIVNEGQARLTSNEQNDLLATGDLSNLVSLANVVANGNAGNGVNAQVSSEDSHFNEVNWTLSSTGVNLVMSQAGDTSLESNLTDNALALFTDMNGISMQKLMADHNGMNGVIAGVNSSVDRSTFMTIATTINQSNQVNYVTGSPIFNASVSIGELGIVNAADFIDMNHVTANFNGLFGVNAFVNSDDTLDTNFDISSTVTVNNIIGAIVVQESQADINAPSAPVEDTPNYINLNHVTADDNTLSGTILKADTITVQNSTFMFNGAYGLDLTGNSALINVKACHNALGPQTHLGNLFTNNFDGLNCAGAGGGAEAVAGGGAGPEAPANPWQIINVYMDPGKNGGALSCQFGTTYLYLEKMAAGDFEWGRVELAPCLVPGGTTGTLTGLGQGALPGALPDGVTFQGKAFDFELSGGTSLGGTMNVRFSLPAGFSLPSGKKLAILWFDPTAKQWVELTTSAGGGYANAYTSKTGTFVLVLK